MKTHEECLKHVVYCVIRENIIDGLTRYALDKIPTGSFLTAVLENNLMEALGKADLENRLTIWNICSFVHNEIPASSHGSPEKVEAWLKTKEEMNRVT